MNTLLLSIATLLTSWQFAFEQTEHQIPAPESKSWTQVTVPHDWAIYGAFDRANDLQNVAVWQNGETVPSLKTGRTGGLPYVGKAWYKYALSLPAVDTTEVYTLLFDGAMSEAEVFVNGEKVCEWPYGYNAFHCDITPYLQSGDNTISVRLENRPQSSRWYPGAGLFRNVHLIRSERTHVPVWGVDIRTPYVSDTLAAVNVKTVVDNALGHHITLRTRLVEQRTGAVADSLVSEYDVRHALPLEQNFTLSHPALWSPESPALYTAQTVVLADGVPTDTVQTVFGIRSIQIVPNVGFLLNGKVRKFQGVCLHHDLGPLGAAVSRQAILRQLLMLRDMGCDAIRTSHNMPAPELIELCDSLGFMVMCEPFDEWDWGKCDNGYHRFFDEWAERDMVNMLRHFRNNPSIVMWSVGNEVPTQCSPDGYRVAKMLQDICDREDGTRPVTAGMDQVSCVLENGFASILQVVGLNYRAFRYEEAYRRTPQRLVLGSETASTVSSRGVYLLPAVPDNTSSITDHNHPGGTSKTNQCSGYDLQYCPWSNLPDEDFRNMDDYPWTIGQFVWTGFDYLGEPSPYDTDAWPSHSSYFGIIDLAGIPKDRYYLYRSQWNREAHTTHLLPHWNWQQGDTVPVMAYTDADEAELFLNGRSLGKRHKYSRLEADSAAQAGDVLALQRRYRLIWDAVPFEAGELRVVTATGEAVQRTAGKPHHIELAEEALPESDLHFVRVRVCDKDGNLCPHADHLIHFSVRPRPATKAEATTPKANASHPTLSSPIGLTVSTTSSPVGVTNSTPSSPTRVIHSTPSSSTGVHAHFVAAANGDAANLDAFNAPYHHAFAGELTAIVFGDCTLTATASALRSAKITL